MGRDVFDGVVGFRLSRLSVMLIGSEKFLGLVPLDALIACKLEGKSSGSDDGGPYIEENMSIDSLPCEVVLFVSLNVECRHFKL